MNELSPKTLETALISLWVLELGARACGPQTGSVHITREQCRLWSPSPSLQNHHPHLHTLCRAPCPCHGVGARGLEWCFPAGPPGHAGGWERAVRAVRLGPQRSQGGLGRLPPAPVAPDMQAPLAFHFLHTFGWFFLRRPSWNLWAWGLGEVSVPGKSLPAGSWSTACLAETGQEHAPPTLRVTTRGAERRLSKCSSQERHSLSSMPPRPPRSLGLRGSIFIEGTAALFCTLIPLKE